MKEYIAETGGRYTYAEDILNLQELALSMTSIFSACSDFIISGCEISDNEISPGYVWLGGKVRYFEGFKGAAFPYYIFEQNSNESVVYANEVNKRGRSNYLCAGSVSEPKNTDPVTGKIPRFIELNPSYSPRLTDKFFGRYALLLDSPFSRQTVKKDVSFAGAVAVDKELESKSSVSVINLHSGCALKNTVKASGDASVGIYGGSALLGELVLAADGSFIFLKDGKELARIDGRGIGSFSLTGTTSQSGSIYIRDSHIVNTSENNDSGAININYTGYQNGASRFRDFNVYNGRQCAVPLFSVKGAAGSVHVNGLLSVRNAGEGIELVNSAYSRDTGKLTGVISWKDSAGELYAVIGLETVESNDFALRNRIGNITLAPQGFVDVAGDLKVNGVSISATYVTLTGFAEELKKKVDTVAGKQLSTEDFTSEHRKKLDAISGSAIESAGTGYVSAIEVSNALRLKLAAAENLRDVADKAAARANLDVYSKSEAGSTFLKVSGKLIELINLSAEEINGLTAEQASALKAQKQAAVRDNLDAEKKGTGDLKLAKSSNLSDLPDKVQARNNIGVYSAAEVDRMLEGKLGVGSAYDGAVFTEELRKKLADIKTGNFIYTDLEGKSHSQTEGYVLTSQVVKELEKKANILMDGLNETQRNTVAANLGVYTKIAADDRFASVESLFQDYITYLVKTGKSTTDAQKIIRDKFDVFSKADITGGYVSRAGKLSDLTLPDADSKKLACRNLGAAYAEEYQTKLTDTGWLQMVNSGLGTDTRQLFIRQIGNVVSIQGMVNTAKRDGTNWGGIVGVIPNAILPPRYAVRTTLANWNDDTRWNRGASFVIAAGSRNVLIYESGWYNVNTEISFTYFT